MELDPVMLSRIQFAFVISFHIIFPAFTMGLAAWLATIGGVRLVTGNPVYRRVFDFWLKVFAMSFGMGVVTGIVIAFQFGTNWGVLAGGRARRDGVPIAMAVAFLLATFLTLGVMMWPYMIPYGVTVADAAAPDASLHLFLYSGIVVLPVIAAYTVGVHWVFRGKIDRLKT